MPNFRSGLFSWNILASLTSITSMFLFLVMQMTLFDRAIFDHGDIFFETAQRCPTSVTNDVDPLVEVKAYLSKDL